MTRLVRGRRAAALSGVLGLVVGGSGLVVAIATAPDASADETPCAAGDIKYVLDEPPALARLGAEAAWGLATGQGVIVAVVDSGVDSANVHLADAVVPGTDIVGTAGSPDGFADSFGHGTAIAGEIAARSTGESNVVGLAKDAQILPVRVFYADDDNAKAAGNAPVNNRTAAGIRYAAEHGAKIINVSISSPIDDAVLREAVQAATDGGALVVASAGNTVNATGQNEDFPRYPAAYPGVLAVTAVDDKDQVTEDSIHGPYVDVAAPGTNVLTAFAGGGDCMLAGDTASTSFAAGYVSAAAALVAERFPDETPAQWAYRLEVTASRLSVEARDDVAGWGIIRPYEALAFVDDGSAPGPESPAHEAPAPPPAAQQTIHVGVRPDPLAPAQSIASWWALGGAAALVGAMLVSRLTSRRRRR